MTPKPPSLEETIARLTHLLEALEAKAMMHPVLTLDEAAKVLGLTRRALYEMTQRREITFIKKGKFIRFDRNDLLRWLDSHKVKPI